MHGVRDRLQHLLNSDDQPRFAVSEDNRIHAANAASCHLLGATEAELLDAPVDRVLLEPAALRGAERSPMVSLRRLDGTRLDVCAGLVKVVIAETSFVVCEVGEVTAVHEDTQLACPRLRDVELVTAGLAHDIVTVLTSVRTNLALMRAEITNSDEGADLARDLDIGTQRAVALAQQLMAFAVGRSSATEAQRLDTTLFGFEDTLRTMIPKTIDLRLSTEVQPELSGRDADQIRQIIANLVSNSAQAMPAGRGSIVVHACHRKLSANALLVGTWLGKRFTGPALRISVQDDGRGISQPRLHRIFDPDCSTRAGTHGLGLASVLAVVRSRGGCIRVSSTVGRGTTFQVWLPEAGAERRSLAQIAPQRDVHPVEVPALCVDHQPEVDGRA